MTIDRALANLRELPGFKMKSDRELRRVVLAVLEGVRRPSVQAVNSAVMRLGDDAGYDDAYSAIIDHLIREAEGA